MQTETRMRTWSSETWNSETVSDYVTELICQTLQGRGPNEGFVNTPETSVLSGRIFPDHFRPFRSSAYITQSATSLTLRNSTFCPQSLPTYFACLSEQTAIISRHRVNCLVYEHNCDSASYCSARTESSHSIQKILNLYRPCHGSGR
jgi:hypothetical protein